MCKVTRRWAHIVFDGVTTGKKMDATDNVGASYAYIRTANIPKPLKNKGQAVANRLAGVGTTTVISISISSAAGVTPTDSMSTVVSKYNALLKTWYDEGAPLEIWYEIDAPEVYTSDRYDLRKPDTLTTDTVTVAGSAETEVTYPHDTKHYIDQKFDALAAALLS